MPIVVHHLLDELKGPPGLSHRQENIGRTTLYLKWILNYYVGFPATGRY